MSHIGHQSQARAKAWELDDGVDWPALQALSSRIQYHLRKRLPAGKAGAGKAGSVPVLPEALGLARDDYALRMSIETPWANAWSGVSQSILKAEMTTEGTNHTEEAG